MPDDAFRRHLEDYAAVGRDSAVPPMVHEIYRRGRRHRRLQVTTWSAVGAFTLIATFLAGMVVRDQTASAIAAGATTPTTTAAPTSSTLFGLAPTTQFPPSTLDPNLFTTTSFSFTTTSFPTTSQFTTTSLPSVTTTSTTRPPSTPFAPVLTSGKHSVIIESISGSSLTFDKVQFFRGAAAEREARADNRSTTNGWYMRNVNPALRTHTVAANAKIQARRKTMGEDGDPNALVTVTLAELDAKVPTSSLTLFQLTLSGGRIVAITEHDLS